MKSSRSVLRSHDPSMNFNTDTYRIVLDDDGKAILQTDKVLQTSGN